MLAEQDHTPVRFTAGNCAEQSSDELNPNVVLRCDAQGFLLWCNPAATRWRPGLVAGQPISQSIPELADIPFAEIVTRGLSHEIEVGDERGCVRLTFQGTPVLGGFANIYGADITSFRQMVTRLREQQANLERLVDERSTPARLAHEEALEAANLAKTEFLANISHELRTPVHAILSFAGSGIKHSARAAPDRIERYFSRILHSGQRLQKLLDRLVNLARFEAG